MTAYAPGEPVWVDLGSPDVEASRAFYGGLLGWTALPAQEEFGGYANFELDGRKVAGLMPLMAADQQPAWTVYIATDDAAATTTRVQEAGGTVVAPPMQVGDLGTMALYVDPAGAFFGTWQAGRHLGSELLREPGAPAWFELTAQDPAGAAAPFYGAVFGWEARTSEQYVEMVLDGVSVAGVADPSQGTVGWLPYFAVDDPGGAADRAVELGGAVVLGLTPFPGGSCTIVRDPHGAALGLIRLDDAA